MNIGIRLPEMHVHPGARLAIASLIMLILVLGTYGTGLALGGF